MTFDFERLQRRAFAKISSQAAVWDLARSLARGRPDNVITFNRDIHAKELGLSNASFSMAVYRLASGGFIESVRKGCKGHLGEYRLSLPKLFVEENLSDCKAFLLRDKAFLLRNQSFSQEKNQTSKPQQPQPPNPQRGNGGGASLTPDGGPVEGGNPGYIEDQGKSTSGTPSSNGLNFSTETPEAIWSRVRQDYDYPAPAITRATSKVLKQVAGEVPSEDLEDIFRAYLETEDKFLEKNNHAIRFLPNRLEGILENLETFRQEQLQADLEYQRQISEGIEFERSVLCIRIKNAFTANDTKHLETDDQKNFHLLLAERHPGALALVERFPDLPEWLEAQPKTTRNAPARAEA